MSPRSARPNQLAVVRLSRRLDGPMPPEWESTVDLETIDAALTELTAQLGGARS